MATGWTAGLGGAVCPHAFMGPMVVKATPDAAEDEVKAYLGETALRAPIPGEVYKRIVAGQPAVAPAPPEPPVAGFTPEQVFFLAYAQSWCTVRRPELARTYATVDPHSPPQWRVDGPLSNLPEFRQAFSCGEGSPMVRAGDKQCQLWYPGNAEALQINRELRKKQEEFGIFDPNP